MTRGGSCGCGGSGGEAGDGTCLGCGSKRAGDREARVVGRIASRACDLRIHRSRSMLLRALVPGTNGVEDADFECHP
jgi:hypothetical protein